MLKYSDRLIRKWKWPLLIIRYISLHYYQLFSKSKKTPYYQIETTTKINRYSKIFAEAAKHLDANSVILSFGCSSGEECQSLAMCSPGAEIVGTDINSFMISEAKRKNINPKISYLSIEEIIDSQRMFDAIFACSVLCRWPESKFLNDLSRTFSYESFVEIIDLLDSLLEKNGLLIIINSNYKFEDTETYERYESMSSPNSRLSTFIHQFDCYSQKYQIINMETHQ